MATADFTLQARTTQFRNCSCLPAPVLQGAAAHRLSSSQIVEELGRMAKRAIQSGDSRFAYDRATWEQFAAQLSAMADLFTHGALFEDGQTALSHATDLALAHARGTLGDNTTGKE